MSCCPFLFGYHRKDSKAENHIVTAATEKRIVAAAVPPAIATKGNLSLAVLLAGYAFEVYYLPIAAARTVLTRENGTQVTLTSPEFARWMFSGIVSVTFPEGADRQVSMTVLEKTPLISAITSSEQVGSSPSLYMFVRDPSAASLSVKITEYLTDELSEISVPIMKDDTTAHGFSVPPSLPLDSLPDESAKQVGEVSLMYTSIQEPLSLADLFEDSPIPEKYDPTPRIAVWAALSAAVAETRSTADIDPLPPTGGGGAGQHSVRGLSSLRQLPEICCVVNDGMDCKASVRADLVRRQLVVSFRGTENVRDCFTDMDVVMVTFDRHHPVLSTLSVHQGFMSSLRSVRDALLQVLHTLFTHDPEGGPWDIYVTGHSLGAAIAVMFAFDLGRIRAGMFGMGKHGEEEKLDAAAAYQKDENFLSVLRASSLSMYSVACPVIGCHGFSTLYNSLVPLSYRMYNERDMIPTVVPLFFHCGHPVPLHPGTGEESPLSYAEDLIDGMAAEEHSEMAYFRSLTLLAAGKAAIKLHS